MTSVSPAEKKPNPTHRLDPDRIIETAENLAQHIGQRLPGRSLAGLATELARIASETDQRASRHADRSSPSGWPP